MDGEAPAPLASDAYVSHMTDSSLGAVRAADVASVQAAPSVTPSLRVLAEATGLRIALIARVTQDSWTACAVLDEAGFGLGPGDQLEVTTTY